MTHGGMAYGAGYLAAKAAGADIIDPRRAAVSCIRNVLEAYPHIEHVLPAMGYDDAQLRALGETIDNSDAEIVVSGTPVDLARLLNIKKKIVRARYEFESRGSSPQSRRRRALHDRRDGGRGTPP